MVRTGEFQGVDMTNYSDTQRQGLVGFLTRNWRSPALGENLAGDAIEVRDASVGDVSSRRTSLSRSLARTIHAEQDVTMALSAAAQVHAGGDAIITGGAAAALIADGSVRMDGSTAGISISRQAHSDSSTIGLLIARDVKLGGNSRVLIATKEALILGATIGTLYPLVRYLLQRFAPPPAEREEIERPWYTKLGMWLGNLALRIGIAALIGIVLYRSARGRIERLLPFLAK
jgi:hypothetical protein